MKSDKDKPLVIPRVFEVYENGMLVDSCRVADGWPYVDDGDETGHYMIYNKVLADYYSRGYTHSSSVRGDYEVMFHEKELKAVCVSCKTRFDIKDANGKTIYEDSLLRPVGSEHDMSTDIHIKCHYETHEWCFETYTPGRHYRIPHLRPIESLDEIGKLVVVR